MQITLRHAFMLALVILLVPAVALAGGPPRDAALAECDAALGDLPCTTDLIAGQNLVVGTVTVDASDGVNLTVTYQITDPEWFITETHLFVGTEPPDTSAPGQFPYSHELLNTQTDVYSIPLADLGVTPGECLFFAAHAVVERFVGFEDPDLDAFDQALPGSVQMTVAFPGGDSYFNTTVSGGTSLDGVYDGYCVDTDRTITPGVTYTAQVFSSYDPALAGSGLLEFPDNLDLVNYIINQDYEGQPSPGCGGTYTYGDVQRAIWDLIEDEQSTAGLGSWSQCRVNEILADAQANGEAFVPPCDGVVAVILNPVDPDGNVTNQITIAQVTFIQVGLECVPIFEDETAWGFGPCDLERGWGWYFQCCTVSRPEKVAAVRFRSFGNTGANEIYLGEGDLGVASNRVEKNFHWVKPGTYDMTFVYDPVALTLVATLDGTTPLTYNLPAPLGPMDSFEVIVADRDTGSQVDFTNVFLDGVFVGDFFGADNFSAYTFPSGVLDDGFTFSGTIHVDGPFSLSQEKSRVEIITGRNLAP